MRCHLKCHLIGEVLHINPVHNGHSNLQTITFVISYPRLFFSTLLWPSNEVHRCICLSMSCTSLPLPLHTQHLWPWQHSRSRTCTALSGGSQMTVTSYRQVEVDESSMSSTVQVFATSLGTSVERSFKGDVTHVWKLNKSQYSIINHFTFFLF